MLLGIVWHMSILNKLATGSGRHPCANQEETVWHVNVVP
jgi:hypothetical protein